MARSRHEVMVVVALAVAVAVARPLSAAGVSNVGATAAGDLAARMQTRLSELESLVRELTGRVEEGEFANRQLQGQLTRLQRDLELRFKHLGAGADSGDTQQGTGRSLTAATAAQGSSSSQQADGSANTPEATPPGVEKPAVETAQESYRQAFDLLSKGRLKDAQTAFAAFIDTHPSNPLAGNAQYWLGETFYAQNDFEGAAVAFLKGYKTYPKNVKAPDNLLKLGLSVAALGKIPEACAAFKRLQSEYPKAPSAIIRRLGNEKTKLGCTASDARPLN